MNLSTRASSAHWRVLPRRRPRSDLVSAPKAASSSSPSPAPRRNPPPLLDLPPGAWAVRRKDAPAAVVLVVDGTNFAAIAYRSGERRRDGGSTRDEFARWLAFLSAVVGPVAATVVAFDNKNADDVGGATTKKQQQKPVVLAATAPTPQKAGGWDASAAAAFVSGGSGGGGAGAAQRRPATPTLPGGAHLLPDDDNVLIPLIAPPGQTADDAIADLCRALVVVAAKPSSPSPLNVVIASSDRDMRRLVVGDAVYFLDLVAGAKGDASPLRLHRGGAGDGESDDDDAIQAAALALTGSRKHGIVGLDLPGITSRGSAAAMVRGAGGLEELLRVAAAGAGAGAGAGAAKTTATTLRALADPETAKKARENYEAVRMGGKGGGGGKEVGAVVDEVLKRIAVSEAASDARADADADADAKALFPPFLRQRRRARSSH